MLEARSRRPIRSESITWEEDEKSKGEMRKREEEGQMRGAWSSNGVMGGDAGAGRDDNRVQLIGGSWSLTGERC